MNADDVYVRSLRENYMACDTIWAQSDHGILSEYYYSCGNRFLVPRSGTWAARPLHEDIFQRACHYGVVAKVTGVPSFSISASVLSERA